MGLFTYRATLCRVIDADTVRLILDLGFKLSRLEDSYRLVRIDAPELTTPEGKTAKDGLAAFLAGKSLVAQTQKADSFGRYLCELWANDLNCSDWLVAEGLAQYRKY